MLVPITRQKFEQLVPLVATASQYNYYWGKFPDILQRLLISVVAASIGPLPRPHACPRAGLTSSVNRGSWPIVALELVLIESM